MLCAIRSVSEGVVPYGACCTILHGDVQGERNLAYPDAPYPPQMNFDLLTPSFSTTAHCAVTYTAETSAVFPDARKRARTGDPQRSCIFLRALPG